jgi:hypothetical protein
MIQHGSLERTWACSWHIELRKPPHLLHYNDLHERVLQVQRTEVEQISS